MSAAFPGIRALRSLLARSGYFSAPATPESDLAELIGRLRPFETNHPLVRIGGERDGGYLLPDDLEGVEHCFSPGVSTTATFEEALLDRGIRSFLADASVEGPPATLRDYVFDKRFLGTVEDETFITLSGWLESRAPLANRDLLLQMDIEGAEYGVLLETPREVLKRFRIMVIEFHFLDQLLNHSVFPLLRDAFLKALRDFTVVHIHPNNYRGASRRGSCTVPDLLEFTFLRNDRVAGRRPARTFPHPLDRKNVAGRDDLALPACWYAPGVTAAKLCP